MPRERSPPPQVLAKPAARVPRGRLAQLRSQSRRCRACPLWACSATQTVFGEGPAKATLMLIGEQPGAQEDLTGRQFVGPAGALLERTLGEAGLARAAPGRARLYRELVADLRTVGERQRALASRPVNSAA
jgi:DNA polymerase